MPPNENGNVNHKEMRIIPNPQNISGARFTDPPAWIRIQKSCSDTPGMPYAFSSRQQHPRQQAVRSRINFNDNLPERQISLIIMSASGVKERHEIEENDPHQWVERPTLDEIKTIMCFVRKQVLSAYRYLLHCISSHVSPIVRTVPWQFM
jgi:hypothetical protein